MKFSALHLAIARQVALSSLQESEESCKKRNELHTDKADTATSHELLDSLALSSRVVVAVTLEEVDTAPYAKASAKCDYKCLQYSDHVSEERHMCENQKRR